MNETLVRDAGRHDASSVVALMRRASAGCYCRFWHFDGDDYAWQARCNLTPDDNRAAFERALASESDEASGLVALDGGGKIVGWLKLAPDAAMHKLRSRRLYRSMPRWSNDRQGVLLVACLLVDPRARRRGVARALIAGAVERARREGARALEAIPRRAEEPVRDEELWTGPASAFADAGFVQVEGPASYPVLRLDLDREAL